MFYTNVGYCMNHTGTDDMFRLNIFTHHKKVDLSLYRLQRHSGGVEV